MAESSQTCEFKKFKKSVDEKHEEIIRMYPPHRNSAQGLSLRNIECKPLLQNRRFYQSVEELSDIFNKEHIPSSVVHNERDETVDYVLNFETHNLIRAHMSFHVKGNPVGQIDNVGAFHLKIDIIIGPQGQELDLESRRSSLIFRFTPILTRGGNKSGQLVFRLSTIAPRGLSFSKEKPLEVLSLVREAGEFRPTIRLPLTDEVLTDIYRIIDIIQKFTFSFDTESGTPRRSGGGGASAAGGEGRGAFAQGRYSSRVASAEGGEGWDAFAQGRYSSRVANRGGGGGGASAAGGGGGATAEGGGGGASAAGGGGGASAAGGGGGGGGWGAFAKHGSRYGSNAYKSGSSRPGFGRSRRTRMRKHKKSSTKKLRRSNKSK